MKFRQVTARKAQEKAGIVTEMMKISKKMKKIGKKKMKISKKMMKISKKMMKTAEKVHLLAIALLSATQTLKTWNLRASSNLQSKNVSAIQSFVVR